MSGGFSLFSLSPKDEKFYNLFIENVQTVYQGALLFHELVNDYSNPEEKLVEIKKIEKLGDVQEHTITNELNKTFITPFDREDIFLISKRIDDIIDLLEACASRFVMFNVKEVKEEVKIVSELIVRSCKNIINLMTEFKNIKNSNKLKDIIIEINKIEEEGDIIFRKAVRELFVDEIPVLEVIKWREIYQYVENTLDACEDLANTIEGVAMKNA